MSEFDEIASLGRESGPSDTTPPGESGDSSVTADTGLGEQVPVSSRSKTRTKKVECRRWMHHRKGVFCKACGTTP